jgi:aspartate racemase
LARAGIEHCTPSLQDRGALDAIIFGELVQGKLTAQSRQRVREIIDKLKTESRCDAVVLGCTELPLLVAWDGAPLPVLDSTRLLARGALRAARES